MARSIAATGAAPLLDDSKAQPDPVREVELVRKGEAPPLQAAQGAHYLANVIERLAANPEVDVHKLEKIIELQERIIRLDAEAAFNAAFAEMQAALPTIVERASTDKTTYAPLEDIIEKVRPILKQHGFAISHRTEWPEKGVIKVVGILTHRQGHSRTSEFVAAADQTGSKNAIQAQGSSVQYGRRYTTKDLLCIVTRGEDDDGEKTSLAHAPDAPEGYEAWAAALEGLADDGLAALTQAFSRAKPEHRNYLTKHNMKGWLALKKRAERVTS